VEIHVARIDWVSLRCQQCLIGNGVLLLLDNFNRLNLANWDLDLLLWWILVECCVSIKLLFRMILIGKDRIRSIGYSSRIAGENLFMAIIRVSGSNLIRDSAAISYLRTYF
jgi:hypothetical protein